MIEDNVDTGRDLTRRWTRGDTITSGNAKIFGIKGTKPFTTVTITWSRSTGTDVRSPDDFILANLRYKLEK